MKVIETDHTNSCKTHRRHADVVTALAAVLLILLFLHTGGGKLIDNNLFIFQLKRQPLPSWSKPMLGWVLPTVELGIVALLVVARTRRAGFITASVLLATYTVYTILAYSEVFGFIPCACGKLFSSMGWGIHLAVNLCLLIVALLGNYLMGCPFRGPPNDTAKNV